MFHRISSVGGQLLMVVLNEKKHQCGVSWNNGDDHDDLMEAGKSDLLKTYGLTLSFPGLWGGI